MKPDKLLCYMFLLAVLALTVPAQTTIGFEICWSNGQIKTFVLRYSTAA